MHTLLLLRRHILTHTRDLVQKSWPVSLSAWILVPVLSVVLPLTGCTTGQATSPAVAAERLAEGSAADLDGYMDLGPARVVVTGKVGQDFAAIHNYAISTNDDELAAAAALSAIYLAPPEDADAGWQMIASTIDSTDPGLAVALASRRHELVANYEDMNRRGLQPYGTTWRDACNRRAARVIAESTRTADRSSGWFYDDEHGYATALTGFREAFDLLAPGGMSAQTNSDLLRRMGDAEAELDEAHAKSCAAAWDTQKRHGQERLNSIMMRVGMVLRDCRYETRMTRTSDVIELGAYR